MNTPMIINHFSNYLYFVCVCVCMDVCVCMLVYVTCVQVPTEAREEELDPLDLKLQVVVSHPMWVLGTELGSSGRAASSINHHAISYPLTFFCEIFPFKCM